MPTRIIYNSYYPFMYFKNGSTGMRVTPKNDTVCDNRVYIGEINHP